jgi:glycosyltransferase involved in cell wall biosynthesis
MPKVSVVIPSYNHARFLRRRLDTVLEQSFQDFEVVILDDCSTDESRSILSEYAENPKIRIELNEKNSGSPFKQWNKGVRLSRGEYIWLAESDDYADARLLERLVGALDAQPTAAFAYCRSWRVDSQDSPHGFIDQYLSDLSQDRWAQEYCSDGLHECRNYFIFCNVVGNASAVVFRKVIYDAVGGADESFQLCGDWKLWAAMALKGTVVYLGDPLNYFRFHEGSVRGRDIRRGILAHESLRVVRWLSGEVCVPENLRSKLYHALSTLWIPPVIAMQVPIRLKWAILQEAIAIDSHAIQKMMKPALGAAWIKVRNLLRLAEDKNIRIAADKDPSSNDY